MVGKAKADIAVLEQAVETYRLENLDFPDPGRAAGAGRRARPAWPIRSATARAAISGACPRTRGATPTSTPRPASTAASSTSISFGADGKEGRGGQGCRSRQLAAEPRAASGRLHPGRVAGRGRHHRLGRRRRGAGGPRPAPGRRRRGRAVRRPAVARPEEAVLSNRPIGVEVTPTGYAFRLRRQRAGRRCTTVRSRLEPGRGRRQPSRRERGRRLRLRCHRRRRAHRVDADPRGTAPDRLRRRRRRGADR